MIGQPSTRMPPMNENRRSASQACSLHYLTTQLPHDRTISPSGGQRPPLAVTTSLETSHEPCHLVGSMMIALLASRGNARAEQGPRLFRSAQAHQSLAHL